MNPPAKLLGCSRSNFAQRWTFTLRLVYYSTPSALLTPPLSSIYHNKTNVGIVGGDVIEQF